MEANILLVDDEQRFIDSLHTILKHFNYKCTKALNGNEAIELLKTGQFDLALLDVGLPDLSGCDIVKFIQTSGLATTAIMLTGLNTVETAVTAMKFGAYDFLSKPIDHQRLIKTIDKALQHKQLKKRLQMSEQKFEVLSEAAWEGIIIHENDTIIEANSAFLQMFGYSLDELQQGIQLEQIFTPPSRRRAKRITHQMVAESCEVLGMQKDGGEIYIEIKSRPITYLNKPMRVSVIRDISDRVRAENEKLSLQKKLAKASKLNALGLMAGSVAHDLNNILSGIVSYPDLLLLQMSESDQCYEQIKKIQEAGKRAAAVVSDLVTIARGGTASKTINNINDIILSHLNSIEHCERLSNFPQVTIKTELQENPGNICCSNQHIHKILLNLIGNSLEVAEQQGTIWITTESCKFTHPLTKNGQTGTGGDYIKMSISDNGPGIPAKDIDNIFDPFYSTKMMGKSGTGLGLSIVWNIVQDHNGWVEVKDNNPGALFEVYLPATTAMACQPQEALLTNSLQGNGESILLIDDQMEQNEIIEKALQKMGYVTHSVTSGEEGIAFLQSQPVDLILLDMMMGDGLNGRETYEKILKFHPRQKAIVISGYAKSEEIAKTKDLGIADFIEKPVTISKIGLAIRQSFTMVS